MHHTFNRSMILMWKKCKSYFLLLIQVLYALEYPFSPIQGSGQKSLRAVSQEIFFKSKHLWKYHILHFEPYHWVQSMETFSDVLTQSMYLLKSLQDLEENFRKPQKASMKQAPGMEWTIELLMGKVKTPWSGVGVLNQSLVIIHFLYLIKIYETLITSYISQKPSCGDTCQIWMWFKRSSRYFWEMKNAPNRKINKQSFSNPHLWTDRDFWKSWHGLNWEFWAPHTKSQNIVDLIILMHFTEAMCKHLYWCQQISNTVPWKI